MINRSRLRARLHLLLVHHQTTRNTPLERLLVGAHAHVEVHGGSSGSAVKDGLLDAQLDQGLVDVVSLRRAVRAALAVDLSALVLQTSR